MTSHVSDRYVRLGIAAERVLRQQYSYFNLRRTDVDAAVHAIHAATPHLDSDEDFRTTLLSSLKGVRDPHLRVVSADGTVTSSYAPKPQRNYSRPQVLPYLDTVVEEGPLVWGTVGDVFYLSSESLHRRFEPAYDRLYALLFDIPCPQNDSFIIDLRGNSGGSDQLLREVASILRGPGTPIASQYFRTRANAEDPSLLSDFVPIFLDPSADSFLRRVAVLVGPTTFSSAESTAMDFAAIPGAIVIGDTTGGGSGRPYRYLLDGPRAGTCVGTSREMCGATFALEVPSWLKYRRDKCLLEGNGIAPDVRIPSQETFLDGRDLVIECALSHLAK